MRNIIEINKNFLLTLFLLSFSSLATNGSDPNKSIKLKPKEGEAIFIPTEEAFISDVIRSMAGDVDEESLSKEGVPLPNISHQTLGAIAESLKGYKQLQDKNRYALKPMRELVKKSLFQEAPLLKFIDATHFLNLPMLYKPAVVLWIDSILGLGEGLATTSERVNAKIKFTQEIDRLKKEGLLTPDLESIFKQYYNYSVNHVLTHQKSTQLPSSSEYSYISGLTEAKSKLYATQTNSNSVILIDPTTLEVKKSIAVGSKPRSIAATDDKVYVGNFGANTISIIDTTTDNIVESIRVSNSATGVDQLLIVGKELYISNSTDKTLLVARLDANPIEPREVTRGLVKMLRAEGEQLYALIGQHILRIDTKSKEKYTYSASSSLSYDNFVKSWNRIYMLSSDSSLAVFSYPEMQLFTPPIEIHNLWSKNSLAAIDRKVFISDGNDINIYDSKQIHNKKVATIPLERKSLRLFTIGSILYTVNEENILTQIKIEEYYPEP